MNVLLIGGGRMGQRHLRGVAQEDCAITLVEPSSEAQRLCRTLARPGQLTICSELRNISSASNFDIAIIATTASGRLEQLTQLIDIGVRNILAEKPLEQTRSRTRAFIGEASRHGTRVWCNHYRRTLKGFDSLRASTGPFVISVSSGAMGLAVNGIHWIDFALHLTGQKAGLLLYGEIDLTVVASGRGTQYRDYGGRGLFSFPDDSRLFISCSATSSAPTTFSIVSPIEHWFVDQEMDRAFVHKRAPGVMHPPYLYGKDYECTEKSGLEAVDFSELSRSFLSCLRDGREPPQPRIETVAPSYELLFDLLECGGEKDFSFV